MAGFRRGQPVACLLAGLLLAGCAAPKRVTPLPQRHPAARTAAPPTVRRPPATLESKAAPAPPRRAPPPAPAPAQVAPDLWRAEANRWIGTPYRYGGQDRRGTDCSGFTRRVYQAVTGLDLPHNAARQFNLGTPVPLAALKTGDLVFFSEPGKGVFHVGLFLDDTQFAHASTRFGVVLSSLREPYYAARFCGARRLAGTRPPLHPAR